MRPLVCAGAKQLWLLQGLTGVRYDAVTKTLHIDSRVGDDFRSFLAAASGSGRRAEGRPALRGDEGGDARRRTRLRFRSRKDA